MKNRKINICWILLLPLFISCHKQNSIQINPMETGSDRSMYDIAVKRIRKDPEKARLLFQEIMQIFPDSIYATRAKLGIADSYYREKDSSSLLMAAQEYQEFVNLYPYSPDAVYAKFQIGMCYFKQMKKPGCDQTNTFETIKRFEQMVQQYPDTPEAEKSKKIIQQARQVLALHFFRIGYYNYKLHAYIGAIDRFKQVMDEYPDFVHNDKLFFFVGKSYLAMNKLDSALSFFQRVVSDFPKSKLLGQSSRTIRNIQEKQKMEKSKPAQSIQSTQ